MDNVKIVFETVQTVRNERGIIHNSQYRSFNVFLPNYGGFLAIVEAKIKRHSIFSVFELQKFFDLGLYL